jgi:hypothetical protein
MEHHTQAEMSVSDGDDGVVHRTRDGETEQFMERLSNFVGAGMAAEAALLAAVDVTNPDLIRPNIRKALDAWGDGSHPYVGDFLRAVLENNLTEAFGRADDGNARTLHAIVAYVYNELPSPSHGSPEKVKAWQAESLAAIEAKRASAAGASPA